MPTAVRIAALIAALALAAPSAALAQDGAGDAQYQDPFAEPAAPADRDAARGEDRQATPAPTPDHEAPGPAARAPATRDNQGQVTLGDPPPGRSDEGTGPAVFLLPAAAAGLALLLGGLALWRRGGLAVWRRPHAHR